MDGQTRGVLVQFLGINESARLQSQVTVQDTIRILEQQFEGYLPTLIALIVKLRLYRGSWDNKIKHVLYNIETARYATETLLLLSITPI